ncbi:hypothetical protein [Humisphaera borealis]|uniref:Uncharacterized protein n=1 Tax=Humisphaera borealis TaxID=2807512 RepID=A0A7M2WVI6_9BACT|nr:hypothetical protein [Humisphaera borealis]QOV89538.1 hypothetical protein IPV69_25660 [Humisphaera borealis]
MDIAQVILVIVGTYLASGIAFAVLFAVRGVGMVDASARGAPVAFRLFIIPGAAALWPALLLKWVVGQKARSA